MNVQKMVLETTKPVEHTEPERSKSAFAPDITPLTFTASDKDVKGRMVVFNAGNMQFVPPSDCKSLIIEIWGAGGGGAVYDSNNKMPGGGGGAGGYVKCCLSKNKVHGAMNISVGKGGRPGINGESTTVTDSASTFSFTAHGGRAAESCLGGKPGDCIVIGPVDSKISITGQPGRHSDEIRGGDGGNSPFGGPGGFGGNSNSASGFGGILPGGGGGGATDESSVNSFFFFFFF